MRAHAALPVTYYTRSHTTQVSFVACTEVQLTDGSRLVVMVDQLSRLVQTPAAASGGGSSRLPHFNPFKGTSHWVRQQGGVAAAGGQQAGSTCLQQEEV